MYSESVWNLVHSRILFQILWLSLDCELYIPYKDLERSLHLTDSSKEPSKSIHSFQDPLKVYTFLLRSLQGSYNEFNFSTDLGRNPYFWKGPKSPKNTMHCHWSSVKASEGSYKDFIFVHLGNLMTSTVPNLIEWTLDQKLRKFEHKQNFPKIFHKIQLVFLCSEIGPLVKKKLWLPWFWPNLWFFSNIPIFTKNSEKLSDTILSFESRIVFFSWFFENSLRDKFTPVKRSEPLYPILILYIAFSASEKRWFYKSRVSSPTE